MTLVIRRATLADVPWLLGELAAFDRFFGAARSLFPPTMEAAEQKVAMLIADHVFLVAADHEAGPVGFITGFLHEDFLSDRRRLTELFWWVAEDQRRGRAGLLLLNHFIAVGRAEGCDVAMSLLEQSPVNRDTLERRGFQAKETSYLLEGDA